MKLLLPKIQYIPFFKQYLMNYFVKKLFASQLKLNPCTSHIQNLCLLCQLINVKQEFIENDLQNPDIFTKFCFLRNFRFDYE